jgi:hypothetical protein
MADKTELQRRNGMLKATDDEFVAAWQKYHSVTKVAAALGMSTRQTNTRRRQIEVDRGIKLNAAKVMYGNQPGRVDLGILNGTVIVFSDAHFWGYRSTAHKALIWAINRLKPTAVIANGDIFDGAGVSRHPRIGWTKQPTVLEELRACTVAMGEIEEAAKKARHNVWLTWCLGNHDARYENFLAAHASQYENVEGFQLKDHFPAWRPAWACWVNEDTVVKHRYRGGIHATHNNTLNSGLNIVTGHLHSLKVTPFSDYRGTRYGVDTGCLAETDGKQFSDYLEMNPTNWRSGFAVLTFVDGKLLMPELVIKHSEDAVEFRGEIIDVSEV